MSGRDSTQKRKGEDRLYTVYRILSFPTVYSEQGKQNSEQKMRLYSDLGCCTAHGDAVKPAEFE